MSDGLPPGLDKTREEGRNGRGSMLKMFSLSLRRGLRRLFSSEVTINVNVLGLRKWYQTWFQQLAQHEKHDQKN